MTVKLIELDDPNFRVLHVPDRISPFAEKGDRLDSYSIASLFAEQNVEISVEPVNKGFLNPLALVDPYYGGIDPARGLKVSRIASEFDIVTCFFEPPTFTLSLLRRLGLMKDTHLVMREFGVRSGWQVRELMQRMLVGNIDSIHALTDVQADAIREDFPNAPDVAVTHYHIDDRFFSPQSQTTESYFLAVGNDVSRDYETLIEAVRDLDIELKIRTDRDVSLPTQARANIDIIRTKLSRPELRELYRGAKAVVLPLHECFHPGGITVLFEALAMAKPLVCSRSTSIQDFLLDSDTIKTVPVADAMALRDAIRTLDEDVRQRRMFASSGHDFFNKNFTRRNFVEKTLNSYARLLNNS